MDPLTIGAVVLAIVSGAAGEAGSRLWDGLRRLVRHPPRGHREGVDSANAVSDGVAQLTLVEQSPTNEQAVALAKMLLERAAADTGFRHELEIWWTKAKCMPASGNVTNSITGGTQYGPVLQGRDFKRMTFQASSRSERPEK